MRVFTSSVIGAALLVAAPATATTTILDFNANAACVGVCANSTAISQSYGDSARVNVTYASRSGIGNTASNGGSVNYWGGQYSDLAQVAWSGFDSSSVTEIRFDVTPGSTFKLNAFSIGSYLNVSREVEVALFDLDYNLISSGSAVLTSVASTFGGTLITTTGYILQIGPDGYNGGVSDVSFTTANAVPEPTSWAMLIAGFGLVGATLRRRRAAVA